MKKEEIVLSILKNKIETSPIKTETKAYAPVNIALCKYWGKRNKELNLPVTSSFSVSLGDKGTLTKLSISHEKQDTIILDDQILDANLEFCKRLTTFLDLFRMHTKIIFKVHTKNNIPTAAGLASSASGFAALVSALDQLFNWQLPGYELSILARLGSGSACRSIWQGFVEWQKGERKDGMDSYGIPFNASWPELCVGLIILSKQKKLISSRDAMQRTLTTSPFYTSWPAKVDKDLSEIKQAITTKDFILLGKIAEWNAMAMHATMLSAWPPITYFLPQTLLAMHKVWRLRDQGLQLYFTQDAGPNLKLLFLKEDINSVIKYFPEVEIIQPFSD